MPPGSDSFRVCILSAPDAPLPAEPQVWTKAGASHVYVRDFESLDELERRQIVRVLERSGGNRERAARALGMSRSTLYRRLADLGL